MTPKNLVVLWNLRGAGESFYAPKMQLLRDRLGEDYTVTRDALSDVVFRFDGTAMDAAGPSYGDFASVGAFYFAGWSAYQNALALAVYADTHDIPYKTREVRRFPATNKLGEYALMHNGGVELPKTIVTSVRNLREHAAGYLEETKLPAVLKSASGRMGDDNYLVHSAAELITALEKYAANDTFVLQQFIPNDHDYRVVVLNGKARACGKRMRTSSATHLNNEHAGAKSEIVELEPDIAAIAELAAHVLGRQDIAGVDVVRDSETGKLYVLEVNKMPVMFDSPTREAKMGPFIEFIKSI